jgi:Short C-terminal domain
MGVGLVAFIAALVIVVGRKRRTRRSDGGQMSADRYVPISQDALVAPRAQAGTAPTVDVADELTKLVDLRKAGALTDAEFQAQKAKLLARD